MSIRGSLAVLLAAVGVVAAPSPVAAATAPPVVAIVGDSYTAGALGSGPDRPDLAWYQYTARNLGWQVGNVVADPGAGFLCPGVSGTLGQALAAHPIAPWTSWVIVQGGLNDAQVQPFNADALRAGISGLMATIHRQAPNAQVVLVGAFNPAFDSLSTPSMLPTARTIGDPPTIGWSTRYMYGFMASYELGPDGVHPDAVGQHQIGDWVSWHLVSALDNGALLHWNGSYWG